MHTTPSRANEFVETLKLALPLSFALAGEQALGIADAVIAGRLGAVALAATGLGNAVYFGLVVFFMGIATAVEPLASQAIGAGRPRDGWRAYRAAVGFSWAAGLPLVLGLQAAGDVAAQWSQLEPSARSALIDYLFMRSWSAVPFLLFFSMRSLLLARNTTGGIVWSTATAVIVNVPLSMALGLGDDALTWIGLPALGLGAGMGVAGIGLASAIASVVRLLVIWLHVRRDAPSDETPVHRDDVVRLWRTGWPIGTHWFFEMGVFSIVTIIIGRFGTTMLAAHQVALQISTLTFCVCLGLSSATSVRVGLAVGARDMRAMAWAGWVGAFMVIGFMSLSGSVIWVTCEGLSSVFSTDHEVVDQAAVLLMIVAVFQVVDGLQVVLSGALRGLGDAKAALLCTSIGHWLIGLPFGLYLSYWAGFGGSGLWWGLTMGLACAALALLWRFYRMAGKQITPISDVEQGSF